MSDQFVTVAEVSAVPDGSMLSVDLDGRMLIVFHEGSEWFCLDDVCSHDGGSLSDGEYSGHQIKCPRHGARFDVRSGKPLCMPATQPTGTHEIRIEGEQVQVRLKG